ncbi:hypothetical protein PC129_g10065 [Phytophthora cactorum]|uniref:HTH CENPB-type domain-containing protein n=1 Tax=Phytophthora cactorum TaxID=29920 RepID=A0A8T1B6X8_9STRA|nr:hypothetical protein PC112_g17629 [Phytophthora cactorum]KAG2807826.1 hypothetical protein PC111_g16756 [Phytophthora cactorum]KAG2886547.1 hypothetical protein PC114_g19200 [Phytophthora cactorum]KAG2897742.1 hypothetical protein PC115_g17071 [Phytophthora cactorum]KAG2912905.1 hypothetical protein PC117_g18766 [Phytophthora cactorum]
MLPTRRRTAITAAEKLAVLDAWEQRRKLIYQWRQKRKGIELVCKTARGRAKKKDRPSGTGTALPAEAEQELVVWINELRGEFALR